jgi:hypothetical protein
MKRGAAYTLNISSLLYLESRWQLASERCHAHCPLLSPISWRGLMCCSCFFFFLFFLS